MDQLRQQLITLGHTIPLTRQESREYSIDNTPNTTNITWLIEDRGFFEYSHPHYKGPFIAPYWVYSEHIYCSLETWKGLGGSAQFHWDYRDYDGLSSYNPRYGRAGVCDMMLPIKQRECTWKGPTLLYLEIFNNLRPSYVFRFYVKN